MFGRWLAPALVVGALTLFLLAPEANGPLLVLIWTGATLAYRYVVGLIARASERVAIGVAMLAGCLVLGFEGGWFLIPAVLAYVVRDRHQSPDHGPRRPRRYLILAAAAAFWGWSILAIVMADRVTPAGAMAVPGEDGTPTFSGTAADLAAAGLRDGRAEIVVTVTTMLLGAILIGALLHEASLRRPGLVLMATGAIGVLAVAVAGLFTIGPYLLPSVFLAIFALWGGARSRPIDVNHAGRAIRAIRNRSPQPQPR